MVTSSLPRQLSLDEHLCFSLYSTSMAITRVYKPELDRLGLTYPQYLVLQALWEQEGATVGEVADRLALESSTVTPLVKRLEAAGLVVRLRDAEDERKVRVRLTDAGRSKRQDCGQLLVTLLQKSGMTPEGLSRINDEVKLLRGALAVS